MFNLHIYSAVVVTEGPDLADSVRVKTSILL